MDLTLLVRLLSYSPARTAVLMSGGKWKPAKHLRYLDRALMSLSQRSIGRLIVNLPPRHGKSELISKYYPFWYMTRFAESQILLISYDSEFAESWGRKIQDLVNNYGEIFYNIGLSRNHRGVRSFTLRGKGGSLHCVGAGGSITGRGADLIIIDDPIKNDTQANSQYYRNKIWSWFNSTVLTRVEPRGIIVLVMTRWHEDDICGRLAANGLVSELKRSNFPQTKNFREKDFLRLDGDVSDEIWYMLKVPAIALENDILGRKANTSLWAKRFNKRKLDILKKQIGSYWFSALYQQEPTPAGEGIFRRKYFRYFDIEGELYVLHNNTYDLTKKRSFRRNFCSVFVTIDLAIGNKEISDYTVAVVFALLPSQEILVLDVIRERFNGVEHLKLLGDIYMNYRPSLIGIESLQYQASLVQQALSRGLPAKALYPDRSKVSRALAMAAKVEAGLVYFRRGAEWLADFENELLAFPNGRNDDQADAFAYIAKLVEFHSELEPIGANKGALKDVLKGFR